MRDVGRTCEKLVKAVREERMTRLREASLQRKHFLFSFNILKFTVLFFYYLFFYYLIFLDFFPFFSVIQSMIRSVVRFVIRSLIWSVIRSGPIEVLSGRQCDFHSVAANFKHLVTNLATRIFRFFSLDS